MSNISYKKMAGVEYLTSFELRRRSGDFGHREIALFKQLFKPFRKPVPSQISLNLTFQNPCKIRLSDCYKNVFFNGTYEVTPTGK